MRLIDIINGPWAIMPGMLTEIRSIYAKHLRGEKIDKASLAVLADKNNVRKADSTYEIISGAAVIPVEGLLAKKMNLFMAISGGASTQLIQRDIAKALSDPLVERIVLLIDSPGGTVDGTFELTDFIYANRGKKPIIAFSDGSMYSAAYVIGSAASEVYISSAAAGVGSIGVVAAHEDISKYEEKWGIKTTEIYAGKYKRPASQYAPLSDEGRKSIQDEVDYLFSVFIDTVARNRGVDSARVLAGMSTEVQSIFIGDQAVMAGLVDGVATMEDVVRGNVKKRSTGLGKSKPEASAQTPAGVAVAETKTDEEVIMNLAELKEKHPEIYKAARAEGAESMECPEKCKEESRKEGATAERTRIQGVFAQAMPGHEALIQTLAFDGKTTGPEAAVAVLQAEKKKKDKVLSQLEKEAPAAVAAPAAPAVEQAKPDKGAEDQRPIDEQAKEAWDKDPKLRTEFGGSYEAYLAYAKANDEGRVRILSKKQEQRSS